MLAPRWARNGAILKATAPGLGMIQSQHITAIQIALSHFRHSFFSGILVNSGVDLQSQLHGKPRKRVESSRPT